ncbi:proline-serine-threonine phosphatase-interacting protein 2-like [Ptychodera flava]|uniref:proline-serine-threonine phosphatase-interacting protein 2-like n=1 Tax=Ptychodera flava TaxID=63121 RepID=UPI00396AACD1
MTRYVDNFWTTDFTSTSGFDVIVKRLKEGRQTLKDFEEFLKQRARAEEAYGKNLIKISRNAGGKEEIGSMKKSWDEYINQTEKIGEAHVAMGQVLLDSVKKIHDFREVQREKRKEREEAVIDSQKLKKELFNKTTSLQKSYVKACKEAEQAEDVALKSRMFANPKEQDKLNAKKEKAKTQAHTADLAYQRSVENLEDARQRWEKDFTECCVIFQALEEERVRFFRNELWVQTNIGSSYCSKNDHMYEDVRKMLEECEEEKDVDKFISLHRIGCDRPAPVRYHNMYENKINARAEVSETSILSKSRQPSLSRRPPETLPVDNSLGRATHRPDPVQMGGVPLALTRHTIQPSLLDDDPCYASINDAKNQKVVKALYDYTAQGAKELTIQAGDVITVTKSDDNNWWEGICQGRRGMFPTNYVEEVTGEISLL